MFPVLFITEGAPVAPGAPAADAVGGGGDVEAALFDAALAETLACPELCRGALVNSAAAAATELAPPTAAPLPAPAPAWLPVLNAAATPIEAEPAVEESEAEAIEIAAAPAQEGDDTGVAPVVVVPVELPKVETGPEAPTLRIVEQRPEAKDERPGTKDSEVTTNAPALSPRATSQPKVESAPAPIVAVERAPIVIAETVTAAGPANPAPASAAAKETPEAAARSFAPPVPQPAASASAAQPPVLPGIQEVAPAIDPLATVAPAVEKPAAATPQQASMPGGESAVAAVATKAATDDAPSQGQERRSPEFMRFAAVLSQVVPKTEDGGRAAAPVLNVPAAPVAPVTHGHAALPTAPTAPAAPAEPVAPDAENVGRLVQAMRVQARAGAWEATVRLKPEHFGEVTIAMRVEGKSVAAVVHAEAAGVRQWLESQEQAVRSGMAEHGLHLDRFVVHRDGQQRREPQQQDPRRRQQPRRAPQDGQRFEIVV